MITPATLGAIVVSVPDGPPRRLARQLVAILCSCASIAMRPDEPGAPRARSVFRALDTIDDLEDLAVRRGGGRLSLQCWRATLLLRALVAQACPVIHDRGEYLSNDDTGGDPQWFGPVGPRRAANDNATEERMVQP